MKANDLAIELLKLPDDLDVRIALLEPDGSSWGVGLRTFDVVGIGDIGHSEKVVQLDVEEEI